MPNIASDPRSGADSARGRAEVPTPRRRLLSESDLALPAPREEVFEIRDFTSASTFERLVHLLTLQVKRWAGSIAHTAALYEEFERNDGQLDHSYGILFQVGQASAGLTGSMAEGIPAEEASVERLGLHSFPAGRVHRLQRWFGVRHFAVLDERDDDLDADSARVALSALVLAAKGVPMEAPEPMSCFVPVGDPGRRQYVGERVMRGSRAAYATDESESPEKSLRYMDGLLALFCKKASVDPEDPARSFTIATRFTYIADAFDPIDDESMAVDSDGSESSDSECEEDVVDPLARLELHCLWHAFPYGFISDNARESELDPLNAPFWKLRAVLTEGMEHHRGARLRNLLEFRRQARDVRSAERELQPGSPRADDEAPVPSPDEMRELVEDCLQYPTVAPVPWLEDTPGSSSGSFLPALRGAARGSRIARLAELSAGMDCFRGVLLLWCQVVDRMRQQWDELDPPPEGDARPATRRLGKRPGSRTEHFSFALCLAQQKFEMLQRSVEAASHRGATVARAAAEAEMALETELQAEGGGELLAPALLPPALLTEDVVVQRDLAVAGMSDPLERAELYRDEVRSDISAFKDANPKGTVRDFKAWRSQVEGLSNDSFPDEWLDTLWREAPPQAAVDQSRPLFQPEREAEMALHYLESIGGAPLLLQLFRSLFCSTLEELCHDIYEESPAYLRVLRDRAAAAALSAFDAPSTALGPGAGTSDVVASTVGEAVDFPQDWPLNAALTALESLEAGVSLHASLRKKFPGPAEGLLDELLSQGEATVASDEQRRVVESLFARSAELGRIQAEAAAVEGKGKRARLKAEAEKFRRAAAETLGRQGRRKGDNGEILFGSVPDKEFIFLSRLTNGGSADTQRMYAAVQKDSLRLGMVHNYPL